MHEDDSECGQPCRYENRCEDCDPYWQRVVDEGLYAPGIGWTEQGLRAATYLHVKEEV